MICPDCLGVDFGPSFSKGNGVCKHCRGTGKCVEWEDGPSAATLSDFDESCIVCSGTKQCQTCGSEGYVYGYDYSYEEDYESDTSSYSSSSGSDSSNRSSSGGGYSSSYVDIHSTPSSNSLKRDLEYIPSSLEQGVKIVICLIVGIVFIIAAIHWWTGYWILPLVPEESPVVQNDVKNERGINEIQENHPPKEIRKFSLETNVDAGSKDKSGVVRSSSETLPAEPPQVRILGRSTEEKYSTSEVHSKYNIAEPPKVRILSSGTSHEYNNPELNSIQIIRSPVSGSHTYTRDTKILGIISGLTTIEENVRFELDGISSGDIILKRNATLVISGIMSGTVYNYGGTVIRLNKTAEVNIVNH